MKTEFNPENPLLKPSVVDSEDDLRTKIFIDLQDNIIPLSGIKVIKEGNKVFYYTVLNIIDTRKILKNFNEYTSFSTLNKNLLEELSNDFPMTLAELTMINSHIVNQNIPYFNVNKEEIVSFERANRDSKPELAKRFLKTAMIERLVKQYVSDFENYTVTLANINIHISKAPIDVYTVIKKYKLSPYVPFMMTSVDNSEPIIKYYQDTDETLLKDWIYTPSNLLKKPKGLVVKVLFKDDFYRTFNISKHTNHIHLKSGFAEPRLKYNQVLDQIKDAKKFLMELKRYIPQKEQVSLETEILSFNILVELKEPVNINKFKVWLRNNYQSYSSESFSDHVKFKNYSDVYSFNLKTKEKVSTLSISHMTLESHIVKALYEFFNILASVIDAKIIIEEKNVKKGQKKTRKLKDLKNLGIYIKSADCQKIRHVDIYKEGDEILPGSYVLEYKDIKFYCTSPDYPFPGFTNSNAPCCFKKDQRSKEVYKRNMGETNLQIILSDQQLLKTNLITTNKILEPNRIGVLPFFIENLFGKDYLRIGVYKNTFLNTVRFLTGKRKILDGALDKNLYKTLLLPNNKTLSEEINYAEYTDLIKKGELQDNTLQDLLQKLLRIGIIVVKVDFEKTQVGLDVPDIYWDLEDYKEYIIVLNITTSKTSQSFEAVALQKGDALQKIFNRSDPVISNMNEVVKSINIRKLSPLTYEPPNIKNINIDVTVQLVNSFNKIEYVETEKGILPVKLTPPMYGIKIIEKFTRLFDLESQMKLLNDMAKSYDAYKPVAVFVEDDIVNAIVTQSGITVPVKKSTTIPDGLEKIENEVPLYISNLIHENKKIQDEASRYSDNLRYKEELYQHFRLLLSKIIRQDSTKVKNIIKKDMEFDKRFDELKEHIEKVIKPFIKTSKKEINIDILQLPSVRGICHLLENCNSNSFCKESDEKCLLFVNQEMFEEFLQKLTIELFNNTDILKGNIQVEFFDKNNFVKREKEKILLNETEIRNIII